MVDIKNSLRVELGDRSYPILIGTGLLDAPRLFDDAIASRQVMVVSNETVAPLYMRRLAQALTGFDVRQVILPDGEEYKTLDMLNRIYTALLENRFDRGCTLLALGGGVIGDMTGFAAATYQRGVGFVQVPTTLLSQVDSSVGGKTGVNHPLGKNMIGAFYQPGSVLIDVETLSTLPDRELSAGLAEVIKYGLIDDASFFDWLDANMEALRRRDTDALVHAIQRSCTDKARVVAADEREAGQRALLNLGHTFGHAIETGMGYGNWLHGEAVGAGMCLAAALSERMGLLDRASLERTIALIARAGLPTAAPAEIDATRFRSLMAVDKKVQDGNLRLVLLRGIGDAFLTSAFDEDALAVVLGRQSA